MPITLGALYMAVTIFSVWFENNKNVCLAVKQKVIIMIIMILNIILIYFMMYLSVNAVGSTHIEGAQGRYFIPIAPLFLLIFSNKLTKRLNISQNVWNLFLVGFLVLTLLVTLFYICNRYY